MRASAAAAACALTLLHSQIAGGQSITTEAALTTGVSTDEVGAGAAQLRAFGELKGGVRFFGELAWAKSSETDNDVFGAAYPYGNRVQVIEAYGERIFQSRGAIVDVRGGRFRTPFGIYNASDHAYTGFLRPPLIRYADFTSSTNNTTLSNYSLEHGADVVVGVPRLTFETALGAPADVGDKVRGSGLDAVFRVQGTYGPFVAGVSYLRTHSYDEPADPNFRASATGVDVRWMQGGVQVRGEWIGGKPIEGATNNGFYVDTLIHRPAMGPVTVVARVERLAIESEDEEEEESQGRQTVGARIRILDALALNVNVVHRSGEFEAESRTALDIGLTWTVRFK